MRQNLVILAVIVVIILGVAAVLFVINYPGTPLVDSHDTVPSEHTEFRGETMSYDDRITFRAIPDTTEQATYYVTYHIEENGTTLSSATMREYTNISSENPLSFTQDRKPGAIYSLSLEIYDMQGLLIHTSRVSIKSITPVKPVPLPTKQ